MKVLMHRKTGLIRIAEVKYYRVKECREICHHVGTKFFSRHGYFSLTNYEIIGDF